MVVCQLEKDSATKWRQVAENPRISESRPSRLCCASSQRNWTNVVLEKTAEAKL